LYDDHRKEPKKGLIKGFFLGEKHKACLPSVRL
jgi:hypothetical protein